MPVNEFLCLYISCSLHEYCVLFYDAVFKSIGCWADSPKNRAMESLEGKHSHLKQHDYRTRINALMKCAEAADEQDLNLFALQNGGQCFGGKNDENTYRKHGPSAECQGSTFVTVVILRPSW